MLLGENKGEKMTKLKCWWIFGHDYTNWSELVKPYGADKQQWRKCKNCNRLQYRNVGYASGVNPEQVNKYFSFFTKGDIQQTNGKRMEDD